MRVAVVLVNYNGRQYNTACIESLLKQRGDHTIRIFVVDNASQDDSVRIIEESYGMDGRVETVLLDDNYGFSYANNVGIRRADEWGADYTMLLNNDTEAEPDMLVQLVACAERHPGSVITAKIYYSDNRKILWFAGGEVSPMIRKIRHTGLDQKDRGQFNEERQIGFATGCCMMLPGSVIKKCGGLDERFFMYYEDVEYSFRLKKMGIPIYYCPKAILYHKVGASSKGTGSTICAYYIARNWLICNRMHLGVRYPLFLLYYFINRIICCAVWSVQGKKALVKATCKGIWDYQMRKSGKMEC